MRPILHTKINNNEFCMLFSVNDFMYSKIIIFLRNMTKFRYSTNNRIVQDALGHPSFSDSTGIFYFQEEVHL